ncbi:MAG TPA: ABC transporter substrate-binding protein, partial [Candidatus Limnocylindrales bacterium]
MVRLRTTALLMSVAMLFTACAGAASPSPSPAAPASTGASPSASGAASPSPSATPKEGGTVVVAIPGDIKRTDSALVDDSNSSYVFANVMEGLVGLKPGTINDIVPVLASDLPKISSDKLSYTFTLRTGVKFHDGTDFNADAVKYNYDRWTSFPTELQDYSYYANTVLGQGAEGNVASVTVDNPTQVTIKLKTPNSSFLLSQTLPQFGIASPTALKAGKADNTVKDITKITYAQGGTPALVGTGPFKWEKWVKNSEVDIVKNADYWNKDAVAHLDRVVFKPIADETAIVNGLQSGDIDIAQKVSPVDVESLKTNQQFTVIDRGDSCNLFHLGINQNYAKHTPAPASDAKPLDNVTVRQAMMYAINRQALVDKFYAGQAKIADNWMPPATPYYKAL